MQPSCYLGILCFDQLGSDLMYKTITNHLPHNQVATLESVTLNS